MTRYVLPALLVLLTISAVFSQAEPYNYLNTEVTRWADPDRQPLTYDQYLAAHPVTEFNYQIAGYFPGLTDDPLGFVVIVNQSLYPQIEAAVTQYCADLLADGYTCTVYQTSGGTPADLKNLLLPEWQNDAAGALLIGDLPVPWFELYEDFDNDGQPDEPYMADFPCDLFYMDLDGIWADEDFDGKYDLHEGSWEPDFWIGTLRPSPIQGNEADLTNHYFEKNHAFRIGELALPDRALAYIDDDWAGGAPDWAQAVEQAWANTDLVNDINVTTADDYVTRWDDDYTHILLASHSSPTLHSLKQNNGASWDEVFWSQIAPGDPHFLFYNLFACSNARYVENNNMGSNYIFTDSYGVNAIGSTKTGSMLYFEEYYEPLGAGVTAGEALRVWLTAHGNQPGSVMWARSWFYGMTNLGDPALKTASGIHLSSFEIIDDGSGSTFGDGDGVPDSGEWLELPLYLTNSGPLDYNNVYVDMTAEDEYIEVLSGIGYVPMIAAGDSALITGLLIAVDEYCPDLHQVTLGMEIGDTQSHLWYDGLGLTVRAPRIELVSYDWREITGDMDGILDEGETIGLTFTLNNFGGQECYRYDPYVMSVQNCITGHYTEGIHYFPLDSNVVTGEFETEFLFFPENFAGIGKFGFVAEEGHSFSAPFFLPGGENMHIYFPVDNPVICPPYCWDQYAVAEGYNSEWTLDTQSYISPGLSFHYGLEDEYPPLSDGALELPLFMIEDGAFMSLQHLYGVEEGYDGGQVEICFGGEWALIAPLGGYPGTSVGNGSYPGGPCYNGEVTGWTGAAFDLSSFAGQCAKIRFRFGSDGGVEGSGWNIDDIVIDNPEIGIADTPEESNPGEFRLYGNYPNPFNAATAISFSLPASGQVKLTVFDVAGRETAVLYDGILETGGHTLNWDGTGLPSGIYFYRLESGGKQDVRKCILLK